MILPSFEYLEPSTLSEACEIMGELKGRGRPLAGGTDLLVNMKKGLLSPEVLVSISRIQELKEIESSAEFLTIGPCLTAAQLAESERVKTACSAVAASAQSLGSPLIRNIATVGGNVATARPAADFPVSLMSYGAAVVLKKRSGQRTVLLEDFFMGPGQTTLAQDEVITQIRIQKPKPSSGAGYVKLGVRKALEISIVNVAAFIKLDEGNGTIQGARIVLGAVAPRPLRALSGERALLGEKACEELFARAGEEAARDSIPIDDFRGSATYRKDMVKVLTRRALRIALEEARNKGR